jgi:RNA polymerase subunit RPABC4/transcription elongation factor Spt4
MMADMTRKYCLNCKQYVNATRDYRNIYGKKNLGTFMLGHLRAERCPICKGTDFSDVAPPETPVTPVTSIKETTVIREVVLIPCVYCRSLMPQTAVFCPSCGARRKA